MAGGGVVDEGVLATRLRALVRDLQPSGYELAALELDDVAAMCPEEVLEHLGRVKALVAAMEHTAVGRLCELEPATAPELLATALEETIATSRRTCEVSARVTRVHRASLELLRAGQTGPRHVALLERACRHLEAPVARSVDAHVWAEEQAVTPFEVKREAERLALDLDPDSAKRRVAKARAERGVGFRAQGDGLSVMTVGMSTEDAVACKDELNAITAAPVAPGDPRTRAQRASDAVVELISGRAPDLAGGRSAFTEPLVDAHAAAEPAAAAPVPRTSRPPPQRRDRRIEVGILVPLSTVLGLSDASGSLDGDAVPAEVVRALARQGNVVLRRLITDPVTGHLLDRHPETYKPGRALTAFVATRDQECLVPGCHHLARRCDLDHAIPFPEGKTIRVNIGAFCEHHHLLKHSEGWTVTRDPDGTTHISVNDFLTWHVPPPRLDHTPRFWDPPGPATQAPPPPPPDETPIGTDFDPFEIPPF